MLIKQNIQNQPKFKEIMAILNTALSAVDPYMIVKKGIRFKNNSLEIGGQKIELHKKSKIYLIGIGKAVLPMALAASEALEMRLESGVLVAKHENPDFSTKLSSKLRVVYGNHPTPARESVDAAKAVVELLSETQEEDVVIGLISGGGSSLMTLPNDLIAIEDLQQLTLLLLKCGASIDEINTIRKHLDSVKGGGLLRFISPSYSCNLILSDVIGDDISLIASGPTCADHSTYEEALSIILKYQLGKKINKNIIEHLEKGVRREIQETIRDDDPLLRKTSNQVIGSLRIAAQSARDMTEQIGFKTNLLSLGLNGEARDVGKYLAKQLIYEQDSKKSKKKPLCLIAGGETTVTVKGSGKGGRNQEIALSAAIALQGQKNCLMVTLATDGEDGPTDAAGGIIDGSTIEKGLSMGLNALNYLNNNDAYTYLEKTGCLLKTGPTGTNVNDLVFMFAY